MKQTNDIFLTDLVLSPKQQNRQGLQMVQPSMQLVQDFCLTAEEPFLDYPDICYRTLANGQPGHPNK